MPISLHPHETTYSAQLRAASIAFAATVLVLGMISSKCKKDLEDKSTNNQAPVIESYVVNNGYITLRDVNEFDSLFLQLDDMDESSLDVWEMGLTGFISHRKYFDNIDALYSPDCTITVATDTVSRPEIDHVMAAMVNGGGLIQIGDTVYRFGDPIADVYFKGSLVRSFQWKNPPGGCTGCLSGGSKGGGGNQLLNCLATTNYGKGHKNYKTMYNSNNRFKCDVTHWYVHGRSWVESSMVREQYDRYWFFGWQYRWKNVNESVMKIDYDLITTYYCNGNGYGKCPNGIKTVNNQSRVHRSYNSVTNIANCDAKAYTEDLTIIYTATTSGSQSYSHTASW